MQSVCPRFTFGTIGVPGLCVLVSPLGLMAHAVRVSELRLWDRWCTRSLCPSFPFGTNGTCGPYVLASLLGQIAHAVGVS